MAAPDEIFRPADTISRQEAAGVLVLLEQKYQSRALPAAPGEFADAKQIAAQYLPMVLAAHDAKLLKASAKNIRPEDTLTRGECAEAIFEVLGFPWNSGVRGN
jgi:hypothetical protein